MRKNGWPVSLSSENILNFGERFNDGIIYTSESSNTDALIGQPIQIGQHVTYLLEGMGYVSMLTYAVVLMVRPTYIKVFWQDGTIQIWMRSDWKIADGQYEYSIGDEVWYDLYPNGVSKKEGVVKGVYGETSDDTDYFEIEDVSSKQVLTIPVTNVILRASLPGANPDVDSIYNVINVVT